MQATDRMRKLLCHLPNSDQQLGEQLIQCRDFESLKELVDSAIFKIRKNLRSEKPKQEYLDIDLTELSRLKSEVDVYLTQLQVIEGSYYEEY